VKSLVVAVLTSAISPTNEAPSLPSLMNKPLAIPRSTRYGQNQKMALAAIRHVIDECGYLHERRRRILPPIPARKRRTFRRGHRNWFPHLEAHHDE
jgi:hypothetical protein